MRDKICIENEKIRLIGFEDISDRAVFRLLPSGIVIARFDPEKARPYYYDVKINSDRIIDDPLLVMILRARKIEAESEFFNANGLYYEKIPHGRIDVEK